MIHKNQGFTLVELAIVIVIIGLLVAGVLQGQELIKSSARNRTFSELKSYESAVISFKGKFNALPGDFANAQAVFGINLLSCPNGSSTVGTCNGNGDGLFSGNEGWRFWQQLSQAKLIKGDYTGVTDAVWTGTVCSSTAGLNVPASAINNQTTYDIVNQSDFFGQNAYAFKTAKCKYINNPNKGILTADEAYIFDQKFDDSKPDGGKIVWIGEFGVGGCTNRGDASPSGLTSATWLGLNTEKRELCYPFYLFNP